MNDISFSINIPTLILGFLFGGCLFLIGYFYGKSRSVDTHGVSFYGENKPRSFFSENNKASKPKINIDDTKVVTDIKTDELEKKYEHLGDIKNSNENISSSINKLKNMKNNL